MSNPQTVSFELRVEYFHHDREYSRDAVKNTAFERFEDMLDHYRKERKRRAYADRATGGSYHMILTPHGIAELKRDKCPYRLKFLQPAIDQTEFTL